LKHVKNILHSYNDNDNKKYIMESVSC